LEHIHSNSHGSPIKLSCSRSNRHHNTRADCHIDRRCHRNRRNDHYHNCLRTSRCQRRKTTRWPSQHRRTSSHRSPLKNSNIRHGLLRLSMLLERLLVQRRNSAHDHRSSALHYCHRHRNSPNYLYNPNNDRRHRHSLDHRFYSLRDQHSHHHIARSNRRMHSACSGIHPASCRRRHHQRPIRQILGLFSTYDPGDNAGTSLKVHARCSGLIVGVRGTRCRVYGEHRDVATQPAQAIYLNTAPVSSAGARVAITYSQTCGFLTCTGGGVTGFQLCSTVYPGFTGNSGCADKIFTFEIIPA